MTPMSYVSIPSEVLHNIAHTAARMGANGQRVMGVTWIPPQTLSSDPQGMLAWHVAPPASGSEAW